MNKITMGTLQHSSVEEERIWEEMLGLFRKCPLPDDQVLQNLGIFLTSKNLARILFLDHIYQQIVDVQGVVFDFGTRWGQNMAVFAALRGIYEPFNRHRKIVGFDTFCGFPEISNKDGSSNLMNPGSVSVTENYIDYINNIMKCHEGGNPLSHITKFGIIAGDSAEEIDLYLRNFPETIIALAYFDFDLYEPTKVCLDVIKDRVVKGTVLAFDELNDHDSPGETIALLETFGLNKIRLKRFRYASRVSYFVVE